MFNSAMGVQKTSTDVMFSYIIGSKVNESKYGFKISQLIPLQHLTYFFLITELHILTCQTKFYIVSSIHPYREMMTLCVNERYEYFQENRMA